MHPVRRFVFRLALASGFWIVNPDAMLAHMPYRILNEWLRFSEEEPFGQDAMRLGVATAGLASLWGKPRGRSRWQPWDFMPEDKPGTREAAPPTKQFSSILMIAQMFGAKIEDPKGKLKRMMEQNG